MGNETKCWMIIIVLALGTICFITQQIQTTNRKFIEKGFTYKPVATTGYSSGWTKE